MPYSWPPPPPTTPPKAWIFVFVHCPRSNGRFWFMKTTFHHSINMDKDAMRNISLQDLSVEYIGIRIPYVWFSRWFSSGITSFLLLKVVVVVESTMMAVVTMASSLRHTCIYCIYISRMNPNNRYGLFTFFFLQTAVVDAVWFQHWKYQIRE